MKVDCRVATLLAMTIFMFGLSACGNKAGLKSPEQIATQESRQAKKNAKNANTAQQAPATPAPSPVPAAAPVLQPPHPLSPVQPAVADEPPTPATGTE